jgi:twinkle protein
MANFITDTIDFNLYLHDTQAKTLVRPAAAWHGDLSARLRAKPSEKSVHLPWRKTHESFAYRRGEATGLFGGNGQGKSLLIGQLALSLIGQGERVCIASFEMKPVVTLQRMARQFCGMNPFSPEFQGADGMLELEALYEDFFEWSNSSLWLYDQTGTANPETVIGMTRYCAKELKIGHIFIDNLAKCVKGEDDYNAQKSFVDELCAVARDHNTHVHLAHHLKKLSKESDTPDKNDAKGSGAIADLLDNVFMVHRNKSKEDDIKLKGAMSTKRGEPDQYLFCRKQRNYEGSGDGEPSIGLWFHRDAQQYIAEPGDKPMFFANWPHVATQSY